MKRTTVRAVAIAVAAVLALSIAPKAQADDKGCSNETLQGTFAYTTTGFIVAPPPIAGAFASVGLQTFDGKGGTTAIATVSQNGNIIPVSLTGSYKVNPDCTGSFTVQISPVSITGHVYFVIDANGTEFLAIQTDPGVVVTGIARRQLHAGN